MAIPKSFFEKKKQPKKVEPEIFLKKEIYRAESKSKLVRINFVLTAGGIGDWVCWLLALKYIEENHYQVIGTIYAPNYMLEVVNHFFKSPRWTVKDRSGLNDEILNTEPSYVPNDKMFVNACGASLVDMGFIYFCNRNKAPKEYQEYLQFNFSQNEIAEVVEKFNLPKQYSVMTPGATDSTRAMRPFIFNRIVDFLNEQDSRPVALGKRIINPKGREAKVADDYNLSGCINLLDQTTLLEAAKIIAGAETVNGIDNGLLHIAGMTSTPLVFGYTVIGPEYREPKRPKGMVYNVYPDKRKLKCTFCMTEMRYFFGHDFKNCIYKDEACLDAIGEGNGQKFVDALKLALEEARGLR